MRKYFYKFLLFILLGSQVNAQNNFFSDLSEAKIQLNGFKRVIAPKKARTIQLDFQAMKTFLWSLPSESSVTNRHAAPILELPKPDGTIARFNVWESSIQEPGLQEKFPEIRTFAGQGIDDPYATIRFDYTPVGFHAQVLTVNGSYYIDPYARGLVEEYQSYFRTDLIKPNTFICGVQNTSSVLPESVTANCRGTQLRTYRLAVACTGEYAQAPGVAAGTNAATLHAAIVTSVNRVVGVYEKEIAVRMILVANNNLVEFLNASTDPFNGNNNANTLINESQTVIDANIGPANYDIGHTFSTGGGGLAQLYSPCTSNKARGITGSPNPTGDAYDIDYVAHEMGHQWGGNHSMAGCGSSPTNTKYEVGSGTTIQAYAGICGGENIQPNSDPFFHAISFDEISTFLDGVGGTCGTTAATGNTLPVIDPLLNNGVSIPPSTPFTLVGSATDADGDALTYNWEQWDFSGTATWNAGATAAAGNTVPLFKSRIPKTVGSRTFPDMAVILAGYPANPPSAMAGLKGETLSPVARVINFKLTVRDNRAGGGGVVSLGSGGCQSSASFQVNVVGSTPFTVSVPNGGESYPGGTSQTITWNNAGTSAAPYNVTNVKISYSTDGGLTYPTVLVASTPNDGSEAVTIPVGLTTTARVKVEAIGNIFFDISNANFSVTAPPLPTFSFNSFSATTGCFGVTSVSGSLGTNSILGFSTPITLTATGNPSGTTVAFSPNPVTPGNSATVTISSLTPLAAGTYTFTVNGVAGTQTSSTNISYTINTAPAITAQPANAATCAGTSVTLNSTATGSGLTYQWMQSTTGCAGTFSNISGAVGATYTVASPTTGMNGYAYQVVVSGACSPSVTSNCAVLTINAATAISTQPASQTVCEGATATFTTAASGTAVTYQWQVSTNGGASWTNISGATSASYTTAATTYSMNGYLYRDVVTGSCGVVNSSSATLTVNQATAISTQPAASAICSGATTSFTTSAVGTGLTYQWQVSTTGCSGTFANVTTGTGGTTATYTTAATTPGMNGYAYRVVVTGACGAAVTSTCVPLTVYTTAIINTQPTDQSACVGNTATFTSAAVGSGVTYQWQVSTDGGATWTNVSGQTAATLTVTAAQGMNGYKYRVWVSSTCNTAGAASSVATLTVNNPVTIVANPVGTRGCVGGAATFSVSATGTGLSYQWQMASTVTGPFTNLPAQTDATMNLTNLPLSLNGNWFQVVVTGNPCGQRTSTPVQLIVGEIPSIVISANRTSILPNTPATLSAAITPAGTYTYQWFRNGVLVAGQTGATITVDVDALGEYKLVATNTTTGCAGTSNSLRISASKSNLLFIYPNPNAGTFIVRYFDPTENRRRVLNIYDSKGSRVFAKTVNNAGPYQRIDVVLNTVQSGVYYVELREYYSGEKLATGKVKVIK